VQFSSIIAGLCAVLSPDSDGFLSEFLGLPVARTVLVEFTAPKLRCMVQYEYSQYSEALNQLWLMRWALGYSAVDRYRRAVPRPGLAVRCPAAGATIVLPGLAAEPPSGIAVTSAGSKDVVHLR
jgi:hypothetical protein